MPCLSAVQCWAGDVLRVSAGAEHSLQGCWGWGFLLSGCPGRGSVLGSAQEGWRSSGAFPFLCCLFALLVLYVPGQIYSEDAVVVL